MATEAKLGLDLSAYTTERKGENGFIHWLRGLISLSPLKEIVNKNVDYLIYDVKGYDIDPDKSKNMAPRCFMWVNNCKLVKRLRVKREYG